MAKQKRTVILQIGKDGPRVPVHCAHTEIVPIEKIVANPKNPNTHPQYQIDILSRIIVAQGWRAPITVSKRSGFIVRGHCRFKAAIQAGFKKVPVDYQEYKDEASEWADLVADNRIAELAEIDMNILKKGFEDLDLSTFDAELAGFSTVELDKIINDDNFDPVNDPNAEWEGMPEYGQENQRPHRSINVHFRNEEDVEEFSRLIKQDIGAKVKYIWHPVQDIDHVADIRWSAEEQ